MKRVLAILTLVALIILAPTTSFAQNTNDFVFESFDADYYLSKNGENHSQLRVVEKLIAEFPSFNQNHGIERAIPKSYDDHDVNIRVVSIQNEARQNLNYTTYDSGGNTVLRIGDANTYVHGRQTYVIEYTLQDVTKNFTDHDEFFWDTNGTDWSQPFGTVTARIHIPDSLASNLRDREPRCFTGTSGSKAQNCRITQFENAGERVITATTTSSLKAGENMSFVAGFNPNTFAKYVAPPVNPLVVAAIIVAIILGLLWYLVLPIVIGVRAVLLWRRNGRDPEGRGTIVPEYIPPKDLSVVAASVVLKDRMPVNAVSAQLIDFAVRGYVKLYETDKKKYDVELIKDSADLRPEESAVLQLWFAQGATPGTRVEMNSKNSKLYTKVQAIGSQAETRARELGFMQDVAKQQKRLNIWGGVFLVLSFLTFNPLGIAAGALSLALAYAMPARTEVGVRMKEYLLGLKLYMQTAEADRIRQLQAPDTAEKIDVNDKAQLVKLYERLLPYAMLFGIEKDWAKQFANLYDQPPEWYGGNWSTFNAAVFAGSIASLSSTANSSFSPPSSSSSSGFSGGGSSGGGGGGGGGGGW